MNLGEPFWGHLDVAERHTSSSLAPRPLESFRVAIISRLVAISRVAVQLLTITATLGLLGFLIFIRRQSESDWLVILALGALAAVLTRCVIIGYIDITSWRAINTGYLGPAYVFMILYSVAGTQVLINVLRQQRGRVSGRAY